MPTQVGGVTGLMCRAGHPADGCLGTKGRPVLRRLRDEFRNEPYQGVRKNPSK